MRKIADALAEDDKLAQKPIGKYLRPLPEDEAEQFQQRITDLKSRQLRSVPAMIEGALGLWLSECGPPNPGG